MLNKTGLLLEEKIVSGVGMQLAASATPCILSVGCRTVIAGVTVAHSCKLVDRVDDVGKKCGDFCSRPP